MSSNPQPETIDREATLRLRYLQLRFPDLEEGEDNGTLDSALLESKTPVHDTFDVQNDKMLSYEYLYAREDEDVDSYLEQNPEDLNEIIGNVDSESAAQSVDGLIFSGEEVEKIGECFKHVINKCEAGSSSEECSSRASDVLQRSIEMATRMAKGNEVQQAVVRLARADPSFMRRVDELGKNIHALKAPSKWIRRQCKKFKRNRSGNGDDLGKDPLHIRFVEALWKLCKQLRKLGGQAINLIVDKIMACFKVAKAIAQNIFKAIQQSLLWTKRAIVDPEGEIKKIVDNPEKSDPDNALGVIGVVFQRQLTLPGKQQWSSLCLHVLARLSSLEHSPSCLPRSQPNSTPDPKLKCMETPVFQSPPYHCL